MITKNYIAKGEGANRFEKVPVRIYEKPSEAVKAVAREIADLIRTNADKSEKCVLGLGRQCNCTVCLFCCLSA